MAGGNVRGFSDLNRDDGSDDSNDGRNDYYAGGEKR